MTWLQHIFGFWPGAGNSPQYLFWSGSGSDLGYFTIAASIFTHAVTSYRSRNCEVHGCWRLGRHATAAGHKVCRRHHPGDALTAMGIVAAHDAAIGTRELAAAADRAAVASAAASGKAAKT